MLLENFCCLKLWKSLPEGKVGEFGGVGRGGQVYGEGWRIDSEW